MNTRKKSDVHTLYHCTHKNKSKLKTCATIHTIFRFLNVSRVFVPCLRDETINRLSKENQWNNNRRIICGKSKKFVFIIHYYEYWVWCGVRRNGNEAEIPRKIIIDRNQNSTKLKMFAPWLCVAVNFIVFLSSLPFYHLQTLNSWTQFQSLSHTSTMLKVKLSL